MGANRMSTLRLILPLSALFLSTPVLGQEPIDTLVARGEALFNDDVGCWVCHRETGEGLVGPSLLFGPTPMDIFDQLESNPVMAVIVAELDPSDEDLVAISMHIRTLANLPVSAELAEQYRTEFAA